MDEAGTTSEAEDLLVEEDELPPEEQERLRAQQLAVLYKIVPDAIHARDVHRSILGGGCLLSIVKVTEAQFNPSAKLTAADVSVLASLVKEKVFEAALKPRVKGIIARLSGKLQPRCCMLSTEHAAMHGCAAMLWGDAHVWIDSLPAACICACACV